MLRGKTAFTPADLVNADLGISPEEHYRKSFRWSHPNLPVGYMTLVPKGLVQEWNARTSLLIQLGRMVSEVDWQEAGYSRNPIDPARLYFSTESWPANVSERCA